MTAKGYPAIETYRHRPGTYASGKYWRKCSDMKYYRYLDYILRSVRARATSLMTTAKGYPALGKYGNRSGNYASGKYWRKRSDMMYYRYLDYILRSVGVRATSLIDVGSGNCPYLDWWDWIPERISVDIRVPYESEGVKGIQGDIFELTFDKRFDICTCFQVLEHVHDAEAFAHRLQELGELVIVSVPYEWGDKPRVTPGHVHDPVTYEKLTGWMGREANYKIIVEEPFGCLKTKRLIALYDRDPNRKFGSGTDTNRIIR